MATPGISLGDGQLVRGMQQTLICWTVPVVLHGAQGMSAGSRTCILLNSCMQCCQQLGKASSLT